jgi:hypothetical protein
MTFIQSNQIYEKWLKASIPTIPSDLLQKHERMAESPFMFMRATFFRWCEKWHEQCSAFAAAPAVLGVGDLHIENFGTWRDREGRLIWGINDYDEAVRLPYLFDLVRLCASAKLAAKENHLQLEERDAVQAVLNGYREGLVIGGRAFILEEANPWLRKIATSRLRDPETFWTKMLRLVEHSSPVPKDAQQLLKSLFPANCKDLAFGHRVAGLGSLGRARYIAIAEVDGGPVAREMKVLLPSAYRFTEKTFSGKKSLTKKSVASPILYGTILQQAIHAQDPFLKPVRLGKQDWITRRLAPHCTKIELSALPRKTDEVRLLTAMGFETANIHLGSTKAALILKDLKKRKEKNLMQVIDLMYESVLVDWREWKKRKPRQSK